MCLFVDLHAIFQRFMLRFEHLAAVSYEAIEQILANDFTESELETIQQNIMISREISVSPSVRKTIHLVSKKVLVDLAINKTLKSVAITDTTKFCKIFYRTPKCKF